MYTSSVRCALYTLIGEDNKEYKITLPTVRYSVEKVKEFARKKFNQFMRDIINEEITYGKKMKKTKTEKKRKKKDWTAKFSAYHRKLKLFQNRHIKDLPRVI